MSMVHVNLSPPPFPWRDIVTTSDRSAVMTQWVHYYTILKDLGYVLWAHGPDRVAVVEGPELLPPRDMFNPSPLCHFTHYPLGYGLCAHRCYNLVQDAIDEKRREVVVKALFPGTSELSVIEYLVNRRKTDPDSRDHTIPFLHLIYTPDCVLAVMPCWGTDYSSFLRVDEPIEKLRQCLEGLCYLHANRIAHGDISHLNIVANYHIPMTGDGVLLRSTFDVRYAFIDFGSASKFDPDVPLADIQATKAAMTVPYKAPEVSNGCPYNPFAADVFSLAVVVAKKMSDDLKVFRTSHVDELLHQHIPTFHDLLRRMMSIDPASRPTAEEALATVLEILRTTSPSVLSLEG